MENIEKLKKKLKPKKIISEEPLLLSTGSTLLNLACSGDPSGGLKTGSYYSFVGDSTSGKTMCALTVLAEASVNSSFDHYKLVLDCPENGALMDREKFFGKKLVSRLKEYSSDSPEAFYYRLSDILDEPSIVVLDSMDALLPEDEQEGFQKRKLAHNKGKESSGSYGTAKAKINSANLNWVVSKLKKTGSILIIISQTRDKIGFGSTFDPKTRSGGKALKFYATGEIWTSVKEHLKATYKGKKVDIGILSQIKVKKNRSTGREPIVEVPIYWSTGIDDIGSCISFLVEWKHWKGSETSVIAPEFSHDGKVEKLVTRIEKEELELELRELVTKVWKEIEEECAVVRKARY